MFGILLTMDGYCACARDSSILRPKNKVIYSGLTTVKSPGAGPKKLVVELIAFFSYFILISNRLGIPVAIDSCRLRMGRKWELEKTFPNRLFNPIARRRRPPRVSSSQPILGRSSRDRLV